MEGFILLVFLVVVLVAIVAIAGTRTARGLVPQLGNGVSGNREIV